MHEQLYFDCLREARASYFVEYQPPVSNNSFANLNLVYPGDFQLSKVATDMRAELNLWLTRYPVPLMASAFDAAENVIRPHGADDDAFLVGWHMPDTNEIATCWKLDALPEFLKEPTTKADWKSIYVDIPYRTQTQVTEKAKREAAQRRKQLRLLTTMFIFWLAVIPLAWETIKYLGPEWLATAVLIYATFKAWITGNKLLGHFKTTQSEEGKAEKQRKMDHYYYHCERNPEGFSRLMVENLERNVRERTKTEAENLKVQPTAPK